MKCPECGCGYELNLSEKHWSYLGDNCYLINSQFHHETIFKEIVEHFLALPDKAPDWDSPNIRLIIDQSMTQICDCSTCFIQSHRVRSRVEKFYSEKNIYFSFMSIVFNYPCCKPGRERRLFAVLPARLLPD